MKSSLSSVVKSFIEKQYLLNMGAGKLSKMFNYSKEDIYISQRIWRESK